MACDVTRGKIELQCKDAVSGLKSIMFANYDDYGFVTTGGGKTPDPGPTASTDGMYITGLGTLSEVFQYELKNTGNTFQQDILSSRDNGTTIWTQILNFVLTKITPEMEYQVKQMAYGRPIIFIEANSGDVFIIGKEFGCEVTGSAQIQGTMDSLNGYTLTATATETDPIFYLTATAILALEALISTSNL